MFCFLGRRARGATRRGDGSQHATIDSSTATIPAVENSGLRSIDMFHAMGAAPGIRRGGGGRAFSRRPRCDLRKRALGRGPIGADGVSYRPSAGKYPRRFQASRRQAGGAQSLRLTRRPRRGDAGRSYRRIPTSRFVQGPGRWRGRTPGRRGFGRAGRGPGRSGSFRDVSRRTCRRAPPARYKVVACAPTAGSECRRRRGKGARCRGHCSGGGTSRRGRCRGHLHPNGPADGVRRAVSAPRPKVPFASRR